MLRRWIVALVLACSLESIGSATSFPPVAFNELVARADLIFVGEVTDVRTFPVQRGAAVIVKTRVVFRVADPIFGASSAFEILEFLGGEWNGIQLTVAEMPTFAVGDRRVIFARREQSINPVVGFTQGVLQVRRDQNGIERVLTAGGLAVARAEDVSASALRTPGTVNVPMTLSDFRGAVRRTLSEVRR